MLTKKIVIFMAVLTMTTMACGLTFDLPISTDIKTGPTVTEDVYVPDSGGDDEILNLSIAFGAGELSINPGADALIEGTAQYNIDDFRPKVESTDEGIELSTGNLEIQGIPNFSERLVNTWDLQLSDRPIELKIFAGAYSGDFELGGLGLTSLHIADGAADVHVNFAEPNREVLDSFRYETGASSVVLTNLGNANFRALTFQGGAGSYELDFSGDLQADASVLIQTGFSDMTVSVPDNLDVRVRIEGGMTNINSSGGWRQSGNSYTHEGGGPELDISIKLGAGNLNLVSE